LVAAVALLTAVALSCCERRRPARDERVFWGAAAALVLVTLLSAALAEDRWRCADSVVHTVCGVLLAYAVARLLKGQKSSWRMVQQAIAAAGVLVALLTVAQYFLSHAPGRMRMYATVGNPDFVATLLAAMLPTTIVLWRSARKRRWIWLGAALQIAAAVELTGSRGGVLALAAGLVVMALLILERLRSRIAVLAAVAMLCFLVCGTQLNARTPWESLRGRVLIWQVGLGDGVAASALGSGPGTFSYTYPEQLGRYFSLPGRRALLRFAEPERHAQNDFVEVWHDTGWLGLAVLLTLLVVWFQLAGRRLRAMDAAATEPRAALIASIATVAALTAASLLDFPLHRAETWALLWLMMAVPLLQAAPYGTRPQPRRWPGYALALLVILAGGLAALAPLAASYQVARGGLEEDSNNLAAARAAYARALRWEPASADANFSLVRVLAEIGDPTSALEQSKTAARFVNEPELYLLRSRILANAGLSSEARQEAEQALARFPYSSALRDEVADYKQDDQKTPAP
jgi:hypothetical protein